MTPSMKLCTASPEGAAEAGDARGLRGVTAPLEGVEDGEPESRRRPYDVGGKRRGRLLEEMERIGQQEERRTADERSGAGGEDHRLVAAKDEGAEAAQESDQESRQGRDDCRCQGSTIPCAAILDQRRRADGEVLAPDL